MADYESNLHLLRFLYVAYGTCRSLARNTIGIKELCLYPTRLSSP